jgi:hypothetical protein
MRIVSTKAHGVLDYLSVGMLLALPRALNWPQPVTRLLTGMAMGTLVYSILTRYELGLVRWLPMKAHLGLDAGSGMLLTASPILFPEQEPEVTGAMAAFGVFEIMASLMTDSKSPREVEG